MIAAGHLSDAARRREAGPAASRAVFPDAIGGVTDWRRFTPEAFTVYLSPDLVLPFRVTKVQQESGRTALTAHLDKASKEPSDLDGVFLVGTANAPDRWEAIIAFPGMEYRIHINQGVMTVEEVPTEALRCGTETDPFSPWAAAVQPSMRSIAAADGASTAIDVLFLYNAQALAERNNDIAAIDADCSNYIAASNALLENSHITNFTWRFLFAFAAPSYPTTNQLLNDIQEITNGSLAAFVADKQFRYGADMVVMLVGGIKTDAVGRAWLGGSKHYSVVNYPFFTYTDDMRSTAMTSYLTVCHELGHNFGCHHDRADSNTGASDGDNKYNYGFRFLDTTGFSPNAHVGTVMAVRSDFRIPYFSNPEITYHGQPIGVPIDQPKAAHNTKVMIDAAQTMANSYPEVTAAPAITQQPRPVSVTTGQTINLSVTATGGGLSYNWMKDGAALGGNTGSSFTVLSARTMDAGTYSVSISNYLGTAVSDPAPVEVAVATVPAASGGGSGGGELGAAFASGILVLITLHGVCGRRCPRPSRPTGRGWRGRSGV